MGRPVVVIVLANEMDRDGTLNAETSGRVRLGCEVAGKLAADAILFVGWPYRTDTDLPIGRAMADHAIAAGLCEASRVLVNDLSRDTVGDAVLSRRQLDRLHPGARPVVCTSDYHVGRTRRIFDRVWADHAPVEVLGAPTAVPDRAATETPSIEAFVRTFTGVPSGDPGAFLTRLRTAHPFYDGRAMPDRPFTLD